MLHLAIALAVTSLVATPVMAAPCRDAKGHFIKCPGATAKPVKRCRTANGKFAKCGTPGAKPV